METGELENIKKRVRRAFGENAPPSCDSLVLYDDRESNRVKKAFCNKNWWNVTSSVITKNFEHLPLFTPVAYHYYLPAYLIHALNDFIPDNTALQFVIYNLCVATPSFEEEFIKRRNIFTIDQVSVIVNFLHILKSNKEMKYYYEAIDEALALWEK